MSETSIYWLLVLGMFLAYVCGRIWLRDWRAFALRRGAEDAKRRAAEWRYRGSVLDASAIARQIHRVRESHLAAMPCLPHRAAAQQRLLAVTRHLIGSLPYFRRAVPPLGSSHEPDVRARANAHCTGLPR